MTKLINKIQIYSLEEIMSDRFSKYAKTIIQDRALPDVKDGLKPVQRRILYTMHLNKLYHNKKPAKCAKTVGDVMGTLHPHGDGAIYEALVRMSQWWKQSAIYIDFQGNNGSLDGDPAAAYRYTNARLTKISEEFIKEIDKETVEFMPSYDDSTYEPVVLPIKYPNLLVNGAFGISTGYATNIPPHNLEEVINGTIQLIKKPTSSLNEIMKYIKGPDFPTGGTASGMDGVKKAFETGKGKLVLTSKYEIKKTSKLTQIIITEIPYETNKTNIIRKIEQIRIDKTIDGILEVRDESDQQNPTTIIIDIKSNSDSNLIKDYLLKNTDLQITFNYNTVAIYNSRPKQLSLLEILNSSIAFQKEIIVRRTQFDLKKFEFEIQIVKGLIKAIDILDEIIISIRQSKNRQDAKMNLINKFSFTDVQAEAIITLQLHRLSNQDIVELEEKYNNLTTIIKGLKALLDNEELLKERMIEELKNIKKEHGVPRKTKLEDETLEIKIDEIDLIKEENCIVVITKEGYIKRVSKRSYSLSEDQTEVREKDYVTALFELTTLDTVLLFTNLGNYLYIPVFEIPDLKWKELGKHIGNIITLKPNEEIIHCIAVNTFKTDKYITLFSKNGMVKRTNLKDFEVTRNTKPLLCMNLKKNDRLIVVSDTQGIEVLLISKKGYGLKYDINEINIIGIKASGVISMDLRDDEINSAHVLNDEELISILTDKTTGKRLKIEDIEQTSRARRGVQIIRDVKTNPYQIINTYIANNNTTLNIELQKEIKQIRPVDLPIQDRYKTGKELSKQKLLNTFQEIILENKIKSVEEIQISIEEIDEQLLSIDNLLKNIEIKEEL